MCGKDLSMIGLRLLTRDGSKIGNAIIYETEGYNYLIETDFGNRAKMNQNELYELWTWDYHEPRNLERWYRECDLLRCKHMGTKACQEWEVQKEIIANFVRDK